LIALDGEIHKGAEVLLVPMIRAGKRITPAEPLNAARQRCAESLKRLPSQLLSTGPASPYPVQHSKPLRKLLQQVRRRIRQRT
jgi:nicotinate phosphoribosyltransferase